MDDFEAFSRELDNIDPDEVLRRRLGNSHWSRYGFAGLQRRMVLDAASQSSMIVQDDDDDSLVDDLAERFESINVADEQAGPYGRIFGTAVPDTSVSTEHSGHASPEDSAAYVEMAEVYHGPLVRGPLQPTDVMAVDEDDATRAQESNKSEPGFDSLELLSAAMLSRTLRCDFAAALP